MLLMSTAKSVVEGCRRRPSSSTRLRFSPRLRRFRVAAPICPKPAPVWVWPVTPVTCGSSFCSSWSRVDPEVRCRACWVALTTGLSEVKSRRAMREPVITTSPTWLDAPSDPDGACWARATSGLAARAAAPEAASRAVFRPSRWTVIELLPSSPVLRCELSLPPFSCVINQRNFAPRKGSEMPVKCGANAWRRAPGFYDPSRPR